LEIIVRIGIEIKAFKNNTTGVARYLREFLDVLQKIDSKNEYFLFECKYTGYRVINSRWKTVSTHWKLPGILYQQFYLPLLLKKLAIDVLWSPEQICPIFYVGKTKIILTIHDLVPVHFHKTSRWSVNLIHAVFGVASLKVSAVLITVSDYIRRDLLSVYGALFPGKKIIAISNGKPRWQLPADYNPANRRPYLFFAGNSEPRKNVLFLVKGLELLFDKGISVPLRIAGPAGWKNREFIHYCQKSRIRNQIHHIGFCSETLLVEQYLSCKAFIYPSLYEGFGLPVLEALCCDCLVITSRGTVMQEIAGECALYFDPYDPKDIARIIESVFSESFDRNRYLKNKKSVLQKYSWEMSAHGLLNVFENCCRYNECNMIICSY
jgi:glycosyltransferase involved in cell wall biosynthesis